MARILLPTRNRPAALRGVLGYLARFYPDARVIVADGSTDEFKAANRAVVAALPVRDMVDYRPYPYELAFFDRLLDVLRNEHDPFFIMGADDDFPMLEVMTRGEEFLEKNPDFVTAIGMLVHLTLAASDTMTARVGIARPIVADTAKRRANLFSVWMFATTYAVSRREHLIERFERARKMFLLGFYDYCVGAHDVMAGKIKAYPELGFVCTRNFNHSYLRPDDNLFFLHKAEEVLRVKDQFKGDLMAAGEVEADAEGLATLMIRRRIAELCGSALSKQRGFEKRPYYTNNIVQRQIAAFPRLFEPGREERRIYQERLSYIAAAVRDNSGSCDNSKEQSTYDSLDKQSRERVSDGTARPTRFTEIAMKISERRIEGAPKVDEQEPFESMLILDPASLLRVRQDIEPGGEPRPAT